jgi:hypothetical protein
MNAALSDGQKIAVLKRFRARYADDLKKLESDLQDILIALTEADLLATYLGEQPEIAELRARKAEADTLERRRQHLGKILERLDQVIPAQQPVVTQPPAGADPRASGAGQRASGLRKF